MFTSTRLESATNKLAPFSRLKFAGNIPSSLLGQSPGIIFIPMVDEIVTKSQNNLVKKLVSDFNFDRSTSLINSY